MMKKCKCGSFAVNIERLTGENCDVCHYKNQVETLRTENAKLIAERDESNKVFDASDKKLLDRILEEREQWMKQDPVFYATKNLNIAITVETYNCGTDVGQSEYPVPLYTHPLPAQQVPEGLAESEFEKYFEQIGVDAWEDHPVSQAYIDGFNRAIELSAAPKPGDK